MDTERTPEEFVRSIDPGLLPYKEELFCLSVTSKETLKYLRPSEVQTMNIPVVFKRMLIERICNMQTPDTKKKFKAESEGHEVVSTENIIDVASTSKFKRYPKRLFGVEDENSINDSKPANHAHDVFAEKYEDQKPFLEKEMEKLKDERDSLTILMLHKKNELEDMRMVPEPLQPMAIPGGVILKTVCDKCHRRGHKAHGNRGNQACPFDKCEGYINCGNLTKHKDYKQSIMEELIEIGTDMGLTGASLAEFVREEQARERDQRQREREEARAEADRAHELMILKENRQLEMEREARAVQEHLRKCELLSLQEKQLGKVDSSSQLSLTTRGPKLPSFDEEKDNMDSLEGIRLGYMRAIQAFLHMAKKTTPQ
ncbi:uncharacterized protein LOC132557541 [Ylistrum balloti]|uniref:uncharacterized protein LOC132557541 n=1 Tax=Ylistrum balloti TaxID=509963 RepID=UPI002905D2DE|nr:uncharacterized protein LOC132557541 [Ylistrum balloti]